MSYDYDQTLTVVSTVLSEDYEFEVTCQNNKKYLFEDGHTSKSSSYFVAGVVI